MKQQISATQFTCDGCGKIENSEHDDPPMGWFAGEVTHITKDGDFGGEWHACKLGCVVESIRRATGIKTKEAF